MPTTTDKASVVAFLRDCAGGELADIMHQVLPGRPEGTPEEAITEFRLFLGLAWRENVAEAAGEIQWGPWKLSAVGSLDPSKYPASFRGEPFLQHGVCDRCRIGVWSHVKSALCPICGALVPLT